MNTPSGGMTDWNFVTVSLTAHAPQEFLSFLAWGDNGNTTNLPPILFLTAVDSPSDPGRTGASDSIPLGYGHCGSCGQAASTRKAGVK